MSMTATEARSLLASGKGPDRPSEASGKESRGGSLLPLKFNLTPKLIIFDDLSEKGVSMQEARIDVTAANRHAAARALDLPTRRGYLTIEPVSNDCNFNDFPVVLPAKFQRVRATTTFVVRWDNGDESFTRRVVGLKELNEVLRPIFKQHERAENYVKREAEKFRSGEQKKYRNYLETEVKKARANLEKAEKALAQA